MAVAIEIYDALHVAYPDKPDGRIADMIGVNHGAMGRLKRDEGVGMKLIKFLAADKPE